jgi:hypothetical protein
MKEHGSFCEATPSKIRTDRKGMLKNLSLLWRNEFGATTHTQTPDELPPPYRQRTLTYIFIETSNVATNHGSEFPANQL